MNPFEDSYRRKRLHGLQSYPSRSRTTDARLILIPFKEKPLNDDVQGTAPTETPLTSDLLANMDAYWRACNYLSVGMIYLRANPLLREPLKPEHIKHRLLGHWGSDPASPSCRCI